MRVLHGFTRRKYSYCTFALCFPVVNEQIAISTVIFCVPVATAATRERESVCMYVCCETNNHAQRIVSITGLEATTTEIGQIRHQTREQNYGRH